MSVGGWLFDVLGIKYVTDYLSTVYPQRDKLRFLGAVVADNSTLGTTDITLGPDAPAVAYSYFPALSAAPYNPGSLYVTNPPIGLYRISYYLAIKTNGTSGSIYVQALYFDFAGPVSQVSSSIPVASFQTLIGQFICEVGSVSNIAVSVQGTAVVLGGLTYSLRVVAERIQ